jgi:hypothetical protein
MRRLIFNPYHGRCLLLGLCVIFVVSLASASFADADVAPSLVVTDEGPGVVNTVGITAGTSGTCAYVYEAEQANGGAMCPTGSWPGAGGQWLPTLTLSEDTLRLTFSAPVSDVTLASTTNYPPGLTTPSGTSVPNSNMIPPTSATATSDPDAWTVHVPNPLSALASSPVAFAVVARGATEDHDYFFSIQKPHCVGPNESSVPGTFPCGLPPGGGLHGGSTSSGNSTQQGSGSVAQGHTTGEQPSIHIVSVKQHGYHHYRVAVLASGPGRLNLVWFQHARSVARLSRWITTRRTTFNVQVRANQHARLNIDATFHAQGGGVARTAFAGL